MLDMLKMQPIDSGLLELFGTGLRDTMAARRELELYRQRDQGRLRALEAKVRESHGVLLRIARDDTRLQQLLQDAGIGPDADPSA